MTVHCTSIVEPDALVAESAHIGPFCLVESGASIGEGTILLSHVTISGKTSIGRDCTVHPNTVLGGRAQVFGPAAVEASVVIGDGSTVRENVTIHASTTPTATTVGRNCYLMANVHIAHDCQVGDGVVLVQGVGLAGHAKIQKGAIISGLAGVSQHVTVGENSFVGAGTMVTRDVLPFTMVVGNRAKTTGLNVVGLRRMGWSADRIAKLNSVIHGYYRNGKVKDESEDSNKLLAFITSSKHGICLPAEKLSKSRL